MIQSQRFYIAREGWPFIAITTACAALAHYFAGFLWSAPLWFAAGLFGYLFRDPDRAIPAAPLGVVSPVDGKVVAVEEGVMDPFLQRTAVKVTLRMRRRGTYVTRSPIEGKIMKQWLAAGSGNPGDSPDSGAHDDRYGIWVQSDESDDVVFAIRLGKRAVRPSCYVDIGERTGQGQRCGLVPFGAIVAIWLPVGTRVEVAAGDRVKAGSRIIATLMRKAA